MLVTCAMRFAVLRIPSMNLPSLHKTVYSWKAPRLRFKPL